MGRGNPQSTIPSYDNQANILHEQKRLLGDIKCLLQKDSLSPITYCDAGAVTGFAAYWYKRDTKTIQIVYFTIDGTITTTPPVGAPCI